jgi:hypothetical protein
MRAAELLKSATGDWTGTNDLRLMPTDEFRRSDGSATLATHSGGHVATISYTWSDFDGQPQSGLLVLSDGEVQGTVAAVWSDSWHQHPQWMPMTGSIGADGVITIHATYGEGDAQGGWWIHVHAADHDHLTMTMDNEVADSGQYEVVRATYSRR